ncbi:MAG TPA: glutamyl-tRNA reductase [Anaeromyxobacteraceae bacterium]|nr:glutamyl-tRNA reductase [Anaeromyxobacteraceae bacterium]
MLVAVGLNQKCASVSEREALVSAGAEILAGWGGLDGVDEVMVLSTCYRVEIFAATAYPAAATVVLRGALAARAGHELPLFERVGEEAFRHLTRVAASLESAIVGEPQILGQVKDALARALAAGAAGPELTGVMNRALAAAKRIRTETAIGRAGVSWGHAAAALAEKVLGPVAGKRAAVIGAGEMASLSARHLKEQGAEMVILNRTLAAAESLAAELGGSARGLEALEEEIARADVVVSAAPAAPDALGREAVTRLMRARRRRLVLVDLAVPRSIAPEVGRIPDVYLCDVDDLDRVMRASLVERRAAVAEAERIVEEETARWARAEAERRAAPLIAEIRTRAAAIAREEVERTLRRIGEDPELAMRLSALAGAIVAKVLHAPSTKLREAVRSGASGDPLVAAAVEIFGLGSAERAVPGTVR